MSGMWTAVAGVGFGIYSGISSSNEARRDRNTAQANFARNQALGQELKTEEAPTEAVIQNQIGQLQSQNATPGALVEQGALKARMGDVQRNIAAQMPQTGAGVAGGRALTTSFATDEGLAGINLRDQVDKRAQLGNWVRQGMEEPAWARVTSGANAQSGDAFANWSNQESRNAQSAYGQAAQGLAQIGKLYYKPPTEASTGGPSPQSSPYDPNYNLGSPNMDFGGPTYGDSGLPLNPQAEQPTVYR